MSTLPPSSTSAKTTLPLTHQFKGDPNHPLFVNDYSEAIPRRKGLVGYFFPKNFYPGAVPKNHPSSSKIKKNETELFNIWRPLKFSPRLYRTQDVLQSTQVTDREALKHLVRMFPTEERPRTIATVADAVDTVEMDQIAKGLKNRDIPMEILSTAVHRYHSEHPFNLSHWSWLPAGLGSLLSIISALTFGSGEISFPLLGTGIFTAFKLESEHTKRAQKRDHQLLRLKLYMGMQTKQDKLKESSVTLPLEKMKKLEKEGQKSLKRLPASYFKI
jgi:hypothetical protein